MKILYPVCIIFVLKIDILMDILFLVGGLLLILLGANGLTDGAASVAKRFHIPSIVIGLTIVAFGTSAPELTVSISSALKGSADIAIGNVVGSNTFNTLMIVGCTVCQRRLTGQQWGEHTQHHRRPIAAMLLYHFPELYFCHCKKGWKYEGTGKGALTRSTYRKKTKSDCYPRGSPPYTFSADLPASSSEVISL